MWLNLVYLFVSRKKRRCVSQSTADSLPQGPACWLLSARNSFNFSTSPLKSFNFYQTLNAKSTIHRYLKCQGWNSYLLLKGHRFNNFTYEYLWIRHCPFSRTVIIFQISRVWPDLVFRIWPKMLSANIANLFLGLNIFKWHFLFHLKITGRGKQASHKWV